MISRKEIEQEFKVFKEDDKFILYDKYDYRGYLTLNKRTYIYHGTGEYTMTIKSMEDLKFAINDFLKDCESNWIEPNALNPINNKAFSVEMALAHIAKRLNWKETGKMSSYYMVASESFGAKVFEIKSEADYIKQTCKFNVYYNGGWFSHSPEFTDYIEAVKWIKSLVGAIIITTGVEFLSTALNNNMIDNNVNDVILQKLNFSTLTCDKISLKEYLVKTLEKQLDILKK